MFKNNRFILILLALSIFLAFVISKVYLPRAYILWDEGKHIQATYDVYTSMATGDISGVWNNIAKQASYPPFQSIVISPLILLFGFSFYTIRFITFIWFIFGCLLVYLLGKKIADERTGFLSSLFFLLSPMVILFSFLYMKEMIGSVFSLFPVFLYVQARGKKVHSTIPFALTGFSLFILFITKYNYAGLVLGSILLEGFFSFIFYQHKIRTIISHIIILIFFTVPASLWLLIPVPFGGSRIAAFINSISDQYSITSNLTNLWGYISYFPQAIITMYSPSILVGYFLIFSFFAVMLYFKNFKIRVLWFCILLNYLLATTHSGNLQERYIFTTAPFLFLLGGFMGIKIWDKISRLKKNPFYIGLYLGLLIILGGKIAYDLINMPHFIYGMAAHTARSPIFHQIRVNEEAFNFDTKSWDVSMLPDSFDKPSDVLGFIANNVDFRKPVQFVGYTNEFSPGYVETFFSEKKKHVIYDNFTSSYSWYYATVLYLPESGFRTSDYLRVNAWQENEIYKIQNDNVLTLIDKKLFKDIGVEVAVYAKK